ncbi:MAG: Ada metal-binding domain-containing protein [Chloroflexota bacterium]
MEIPSIDFSIEKDARYDGHFYRAIITTGIFCRPICPSRPARAENILFFSTAAAAAEAGFRPCLRCRPESAPDRPDGVGVSRLIRQALHLISQNIQGDELAQRLHLSSRQLRRRFVQELGAPPTAVIQTRKLLFAKKLLDETNLPMTEVTFCAGYSSVRRFNAAIRQTYGRTPTEIRNSRRNRHLARQQTAVQLKLFFRPPLDWAMLWRQLAARALPTIEEVSENHYRRLVRYGADVGHITVTPHLEGNYLLLQTPAQLSRHLLDISERCKQLFDLRTDPAFVGKYLENDAVLAELLNKHKGVRLVGGWNSFETAVQTIVSQQTCNHATTHLMKQLMTRFGEEVEIDGQAVRLFPTPQQLATANLTTIDISPQKATAIQAVAHTLLAGKLDWYSAKSLPQTIEAMTALPGIDDWTAQMLAIRVMKEGNAFPAHDHALRQATTPANAALISPTALHKQAEAWQPFRAYAAQLLWTKTNEPNT